MRITLRQQRNEVFDLGGLFGEVSDVDPANENELADAAEVSGDAAEENAEEVAAAVARRCRDNTRC
jgi:hypothetical protein